MGQNSITNPNTKSPNKIRKTEADIRFTNRATYIIDKDGTPKLSRIETFSRPIFLPDGWERAEDWHKPEKRENAGKSEYEEENRKRAIRRASVRVMDLVASNSFDLFATLTISPEMLNRTDYHAIEHAFSTWASNRVQRNNLSYIAVPEHHADGQAIHLHMLANDTLKLKDSGIMQEGKTVYNLPDWKWGFSTAKRITGEYAGIACAKYCLKYMRKQEGQKIGGRYFLAGGKLNKPIYEYANTPEELQNGQEPLYEKTVCQDWGTYKVISFI